MSIIYTLTMKWFQQVQQQIQSLKKQNAGGEKTEYVDAHNAPKSLADKYVDKYQEHTPTTQRLVGSTKHFTIYSASPTTGKIFMIMPRTSMYIDVDEARELYNLLLTAVR